MNQEVCKKYISILKEELIPAMACTEPIALAYAAAKGRELLGDLPGKVVVKASGSIIKNTKSVIVPNTNQMKGIPVAVAAGIVGGRAELELQVISKVTEEQVAQIQEFLENVPITVESMDDGHVFDILIEQYVEEEKTVIRIVDYHTNIVYISKNEEVLLDKISESKEKETEVKGESSVQEERPEDVCLSMKDIWEFANEVNLEEIRETIQQQIDCNWAIAMEGMKQKYGANIGKVLSDVYGDGVQNLACAMAAAGSDARMNGCEMPVVVNSGSGNQGMTVAVPVLVYAKHLESEEERLLRALVLANMIAIYEKTGIGRLSAYCGAVSAGAAAAAGIAYLNGDDYDTVIHTVVNALAASSGIVCDGAKSILRSQDSHICIFRITRVRDVQEDQQFYAGDGIVAPGIEATLKNVGELASKGMYETNSEIIRMMTQC